MRNIMMESSHHSTPAAVAPSLPPGDWRVRLAIEAGCETSSIAALLQRDARSMSPDLLRGLAIRLDSLSSVVLSCLNDEGAAERDVSTLLFGPELIRSSARPHLVSSPS
jgi:hypothetical protein